MRGRTPLSSGRRPLPARLTRIAEAAEARAAALRDAHDAGLIAAPHRVSPDWRPPWELQRESPRLPVIAWQLLDRAFDQLTATLDDPDTDLHTCACAYDQLGKAAREGAKQLHNDDGQRELSSDSARCSFCGKPARDVHKIITGGPNQRDLRRMRRPLRRSPRRRTRRRLAHSPTMNANTALSANELSDESARMLADSSARKQADNHVSRFVSKRAGRTTDS